MGSTTKERILEAALASFARNGYKGTNLRDLAADLGLSKSALYKHYDGKEAIWNTVLDMMEEYYTERFGSPDKMPAVPKSCDELLEMTMNMLDFTMHDQRVILTRRILLTEQFRDERARKFATLHFMTGTKDMYAHLFSEMMDKGILMKDDPEILAVAYTAPITLMVHLCDREPEREQEIADEMKRFIKHFISVYGNNK